ncbi:MAG: pentapeptide repeat-containing protein [Planctomycetaceae bacterium]|nr:pentapeptide repeat-containing protein [Planctomycetaceae bacterium]
MIEPELAPVTPRVIWPETGDALPIGEVLRCMEGRPNGAIEIVGGCGTGKTTALRHLAAVAPAQHGIAWLDDAEPAGIEAAKRDGWVICTHAPRDGRAAGHCFALAGWGADERIEYLLAAYPAQCRSVITRLAATGNASDLGDSPTLWRTVLDAMACDASIETIDDALWRRVVQLLPREKKRRRLEEFCVAVLSSMFLNVAPRRLQRCLAGCDEETVRLASLGRVMTLLRVDYLAWWLRTSKKGDPFLATDNSFLARAGKVLGSQRKAMPPRPIFPEEVLSITAKWIADSREALARLDEILSSDEFHLHAMAASIRHIFGDGWKPERRLALRLTHGSFRGAKWEKIDLRDMQIKDADLSQSRLDGGRLDRVQAICARFVGASITDASLVRIVARYAHFTGANLSGSNLRGAELDYARLCRARLAGADLTRAVLKGADLRGACLADAVMRHATLRGALVAAADFTGTNLEGADLREVDLRSALLDRTRLVGADMRDCDLEGLRLVNVEFRDAGLAQALFSGSKAEGCSFRKATLRGAGLADVQWEGVDLRGADLHGAVFHLGSSRSGLVGSPLASEGTRTGFYTDEFDQQSFCPPEQIRKANLCGADLRGAKVDGVDFYLVDLRGAKYDADQLEHFRKCGAILSERQ